MNSPSFLLLIVLSWITSTTQFSRSSSSTPRRPQDTLRKWLSIKTTIENNIGDYTGFHCNTTIEQSLTWEYMKPLLTTKRSHFYPSTAARTREYIERGILSHAWPRLDSFYSELFRPLTDVPIGNTRFCGWDYRYVCDKGECTSCEIDNENVPAEESPGSVCNLLRTAYKDPMKVKVSRARMAELKSMVLPPESYRPGFPSAQELVAWMDSKMERKEGIQSTVGGDCYVPIRTQESLKYLRFKLFNKGIRSLEQVQNELDQHSVFYSNYLKWLAGLEDPSSFTPCEDGMFCSLDGMCEDCANYEDEWYKKPHYYYYTTLFVLCEPGPYMHNEKHDFYVSHEKSKYKSSREAFRHWFSTAEKITQFTVNENSTENYCSASVNQTASWIALMDLFHFTTSQDGTYTPGPGNIMATGWPRIAWYEIYLDEVLKEGVAENTIFCEWNPSKKSELVCVQDKCVDCSEAARLGQGSELYPTRCNGASGLPGISRSALREEQLEGILVKLEDLRNYPAESISLEDALYWKEKFGRNSLLEKLEDCDAPPELTLSQKFLIRMWDGQNNMENHHLEELKWLIGEDWTRDRKMCGDGLVCGPEGICVPCGLSTFRNKILDKICNEYREKEFFVEKEVFVRPTRKPGSRELLTTTKDSEYGMNCGGTLSCGVVVVVSVLAVLLFVIGSGF